MNSAVIPDVALAGLMTIVFPAARAGAKDLTSRAIGAFHGTIIEITPIGSLSSKLRLLDPSRIERPKMFLVTPE
jgi:hypothetical protein